MEEVDLDEQERRRKRAERFGNPVVVRLPNCPMIHSCLRKLGAGCKGLTSRVSALTVFTNVLLPLWILCTIMIGDAMRCAPLTRGIPLLLGPSRLNSAMRRS